MNENQTVNEILDIAFSIHKALGPGLLESAYEAIMEYELIQRGHKVERQVYIPVIWKNVTISESFRVDIIVDHAVLIELKATEKNNPVYARQVLTYLKITGLKLGLVINFGSSLLKNGIERIANDL